MSAAEPLTQLLTPVVPTFPAERLLVQALLVTAQQLIRAAPTSVRLRDIRNAMVRQNGLACIPEAALFGNILITIAILSCRLSIAPTIVPPADKGAVRATATKFAVITASPTVACTGATRFRADRTKYVPAELA